MSDRQRFKVSYQVEDSYVGGSRPQHFYIDADELMDLEGDDQIEQLLEELTEENFRENIFWSLRNSDEFMAWARAQIAKAGGAS